LIIMTSIHSQGNRRRARGATLFELLVVMAVVAVILGILMPGVLRLRGVADREKCQNNLRQILAAVHGYASANQDHLPAYSKSIRTGPGSAFYWLLPQIGHEDIYRASVNAGGWYGCSDRPVPLYQCSMDLTMHNGMAANSPMTNPQGAPVPIAGSSYALNFRVFAGEDNHTFNLESPYTLKDIPDGAANTIFIAERAASNNLGEIYGSNGWGWPGGDNNSGYYFGPLFGHPNQGINLPQFDPTGVGTSGAPIWQTVQGFHPGVCIVGMGDGSVRVISATVEHGAWVSAVLPDDGTPAAADW
jgi:type II secretory pathway pseudopilin PulG